MGLFRKKQKTDANQINNMELQEQLVNSALSVLVDMQKITPDDFADVEVEFGYLFMIEGHGLEALFKIEKNDDVYYFAAQQAELMLVDINEGQYDATVDRMVSQHA